MKRLLFAVLYLAGGTVWPDDAGAMPPFKKAFEEKYVKNHPSAEFQDAFKSAGCNACHVPEKPKTENNAYGQELAKLIPGSANARMKAANAAGVPAAQAEAKKLLVELEEAFGKVEKLKIDPKNPASPTFGDRIKQGLLPAP